MKIISLKLRKNKFKNINELLKIEGSISKLIIISGYIDLDIVKELIEYLKNNRGRRKPSLEIYTDSSSSKFYSDSVIEKKYKILSKNINKFFYAGSGIFLVRFGKLFHSKCFVIQSNTHQKAIIGSLNFTKKGLNENEELILSDSSKLNDKTTVTKLSNWTIDNYIKKLRKKSKKVTPKLKREIPPLSLRHILLEGNIYYKSQENDPFRFKLCLPEEVTDVDAGEIHPLLEGRINDSISVKALITGRKSQGGLAIKLPEIKGSKLSWRKYCVETCYGYWNPVYFSDEITEVLKKRKKKRSPYYKKIKEILKKRKKDIFEKFSVFTKELNEHILNGDNKCDWEYYRTGKIHTNWKEWYSKLEKKLINEEYYNKLVSGVAKVTVPDVWNDQLSAKEFEESFLESLIYYWSKEISRTTQNIIAQTIKINLRNLKLSVEDTDDIEELKSLIEKWITKYKGHELFYVED